MSSSTQTPPRPDTEPNADAAPGPQLARLAVVALWLGAASLIYVAVRWGRELQRTAPEIFLGAAPLVGRNFRDGWDWRFGWGLIVAGVIAATVVWALLTGWWERVRFRWVLAGVAVAAAGFAVALAATDGSDGLLYGAVHETEYLANLEIAPPAGEFVRDFAYAVANDAPRYSVHVRGHPPGFLLTLMAMDAVGLGGGWPVVLLSVLGTALLPVFVVLAVRSWASELAARRAAPFLVVAPYALWMMTSADAVFTAQAAGGVALALAGMRRTGRRAVWFGSGAGTVLAMALFFTYGVAVFLAFPVLLAVLGWRRGLPGVLPMVSAAVLAAAVVTAAWWAAGFWWFEGAAATRVEYWEGTAQFRVWTYFTIANVAATLFAVGPATLAAFTMLRDRMLWALAGGGLLALSIALASQHSKGEVERIWVLFFPWLVVASAALYRSRARWVPGAWLGAQAAFAIVLQAALVSKW